MSDSTTDQSPDDIARQRLRASRDGHERLKTRVTEDRAKLKALRDAKADPKTVKKMDRICDQSQQQMLQFGAQVEAFEAILRGEP